MSTLFKNPYMRLSDPSLWGVIVGNLVSIYLAFSQGWPLAQIMWIYWGQSVIIGVMNVIRMLRLKEFTTEGMTQNGSPVPETQEAKRGIAFFFTIHYGFFHLMYAVFLWQGQSLNTLAMNEALLMMLGLSAFVGSHSFSLMHNSAADFRQAKPNLGTLMFYPYLRILPMHITIVMGGMLEGIISGTGLIIFMSLKTFADAGTHMIEHYLFQKPGKENLKV